VVNCIIKPKTPVKTLSLVLISFLNVVRIITIMFFFLFLSLGQQPLGPNTIFLNVCRSCDSLTASQRVNSVQSVMLSVHSFRGLPACCTPSTEPSNTFFTSRSYAMQQIWSKRSSFLCRIMSIIVSFLSKLSLSL